MATYTGNSTTEAGSIEVAPLTPCPLTAEKMAQIFPTADASRREEVLKTFKRYCNRFEINTPLRIAHFFAQVKEEVGDGLRGKVEDLTYSVAALQVKFGRYFNTYPHEAQLFGYKNKITIQQYNLLPIQEKALYIRSGNKYYKQLANEDEIAKRIYCCNNSSGYFTLVQGGCQDGILYKGKGFLQLTWKGNYAAVNNILQQKVPEEGLDIVTNPDSIIETIPGLLSAMGYWEWKNLNTKADQGQTPQVVNSITEVVNYYTSENSYLERRNNFILIKQILGL